MKLNATLLVVDDNKAILTAVGLLMRNHFREVLTISSPEQLPAMLKNRMIEVILLDMNFKSSINSGNEGLFWLRKIKETSPETEVVLFTAYADISLAVKGMKEGAADFIVKPFDNSRLIETLQGVCRNTEKKKEPVSTEKTKKSSMFWGTSAKMRQLHTLVEKISKTDANVLITGENGTGKELLAREIHRLSNRERGPMVPIDMGAITETLFESELFGHKKGAFTDAIDDRMGKFEMAEGGTLFMDEIGNLSYPLQAKLLRALQQRHIVRVGDNRPIPVNIRLICATNRDLRGMAAEGAFREDLLYRINTIHLHLPALRERKEDIPAFVQLFLDKYANKYGKERFTALPDGLMKLSRQPWFGNIRELEHVVEKAVIMNEKHELGAEDFDYPTVEVTEIENGKENEPQTIEEMERALIKQSIENCEGNLSLAAQQLGISRQTLYNKLKRYGL